MENKNILNYIIYGIIALIVIVGILFLTSGEKTTSNETKEEVKNYSDGLIEMLFYKIERN